MLRQKKTGGLYYYEIMVAGKRYNGVCKGCSTKREAEAYEKKYRALVIKAAEQKNVKQFVETFRDELSGGTQIMLADAYELSLKKPHRRVASDQVIAQKREIFRDFVAFMADRYPDAKTLADVSPSMGEEYIQMVRTSGRFNKVLTYIRNGQTLSRPVKDKPSSRTANLYLTVCAEVFRLLERDAGIAGNPFSMPKAKADEENREAFTEAELRTIYEKADSFTRPLFTIAIMTALREGDICTLKWTDIDFTDRVIRRIMNKTGYRVEIPLTDELFAYLVGLKAAAGDSEYVLPEHAKMYLQNRSGVAYRIKQFLENIGIRTTRTPAGRTRAVSVKDLHSCRHTFCYYAGLKGIPLSVVQSIVGHMTPEMTNHYSAHATLADKRKSMKAMSSFISAESAPFLLSASSALPEPPGSGGIEADRAALRHLADELPPEAVKEILNHYGRR